VKSIFGKVSSKSILKILSYLSIFKILLKSIFHNTGGGLHCPSASSCIYR